jgi:tetratricopeptide (TPR) repeat protein
MNDHEAESALQALMRLRQLPFGRAHTEAATRLAAQVDADGIDEVRAFADYCLVEAHVWGGTPRHAYVPFTRLLALWDTRPELFDAVDKHNLFWAFKWMVCGLSAYPTVAAEQIEATLVDMRRRYAEAGCPTSAVRLEEFRWHSHRGTGEAEHDAYLAWVTTPRDEFSNCPACEPTDRAEHLLGSGRTAEGIAELEALLEAGHSCATEPQDAMSVLMLAQLRAGRPEEARRLHLAAYPTTRRDQNLAVALGRHLHFLALTGNLARGRRVLLDHAGFLLELPTPLRRLSYLRGAESLLSRLVTAQGPDQPLTLQAPLPGTTGELLAWVRGEVDTLAAAFDARNGTHRFAGEVAVWRSEPALPEPLPLSTVVAEVLLQPGSGEGTPGDAATDAGAEAATAAALVAGSGAPVAGVGAGGSSRTAGPPADPLEQARIAVIESGAGAPRAGALRMLAERLATRGEHAEAGTSYARSAAEWSAAGDDVAAGWALAEAGHCAELLDDVTTACAAYQRAWTHLVVGVGHIERAPVARAWARALAADARADEAAVVMRGLLAELDAAGTGLGEGEPVRLVHERALCEDVLARALATIREYTAAVELARRCAPAFARVAAVSDAAHAFLLAGRITAEHLADPQGALEDLESAVEGFALARQRTVHVEAVERYAAALEACGRGAETGALWDRLTMK